MSANQAPALPGRTASSASAGLAIGGPGVRLEEAVSPTPFSVWVERRPNTFRSKAHWRVEHQLEARPVDDRAVQTLAEQRAGQVVRSVAVETHVHRVSGTGTVEVGTLNIDLVDAPELTCRDNEIVGGLVVVGVVLAVL
jgi:hypothetical protein